MRHFLSDIDHNVFLVYDWADSVVDIRKQFPLDRRETRAIAGAMGCLSIVIFDPAQPISRFRIVSSGAKRASA